MATKPVSVRTLAARLGVTDETVEAAVDHLIETHGADAVLADTVPIRDSSGRQSGCERILTARGAKDVRAHLAEPTDQTAMVELRQAVAELNQAEQERDAADSNRTAAAVRAFEAGHSAAVVATACNRTREWVYQAVRDARKDQPT